ncbi:putative AbiEii toxin of type IV toxin-antitoxin system [Orbus hercynius]|uniref:Putative AbiEii toxin of type IV toxin-antitoxin system n=1 Tax=Orbus hercynius TaxID=593135 RepID=A0A495RHB3_9GAMM|nr:AAA family ATPase [Orbus hercynius]RKS86882.1 putative AbiEii toxin of type IV toxin-antitoxin system [Orbus hercynius]
MFQSAKSKVELGLQDNKSIVIKKIKAVEIETFRTFNNQKIELGENITVFIGRNGTMKTSLMGLIAHPFGAESKDAFGKSLKTPLTEVFKFSEKYDQEQYKYYLYIEATEQDTLIKEPVTISYRKDENRHRIVVSGHEKGDGNFNYNTSFLNLKRLLPLIDTKAKPDLDEKFVLSDGEQRDQKHFYESVLPSTEYGKFEAIHEKNTKTTYAPSGDNIQYDFSSISSGEDNLGAIFNRLVGFQRAYQKGQIYGNGIFCIDEFESSLHPIAQLRLFKFLYEWSLQYKVQIVLTTHSLHLIQHIYLKYSNALEHNRIVLNFVSCSTSDDKNYPIIKNPDYFVAYKELTLQTPDEVAKAKKINVFCEDEIAIHFTKKLIKKKEIINLISFHSNLNYDPSNTGTPYTSLATLCANYPLLLENAFALFDPDVVPSMLKKIKNKNTYLVLPDDENLAIERRIICYIIDLPKSDAFFTKFGNEKDWFLNQFTDAGIMSLNIEDIKNQTNIDVCKRWANQNVSDFKKYVTYYCGHLTAKADFVSSIIQQINRINKNRGLPLISEI